MADPALEAYVDAIEAHLARRRGRLSTLSPADFALARRWHAAGLPLERVTAGIDRVFAAGHSPGSLGYCRRVVEARPGRTGAPGGPSAPAVSEPDSAAERLIAAIDPLPGPARGSFAKLRAELHAADSLDPAVLERLDGAIDEVALAALPAAERARHEAYAERAARRQHGHVSEVALAQARRRHLLRCARESLGLPYLTG